MLGMGWEGSLISGGKIRWHMSKTAECFSYSQSKAGHGSLTSSSSSVSPPTDIPPVTLGSALAPHSEISIAGFILFPAFPSNHLLLYISAAHFGQIVLKCSSKYMSSHKPFETLSFVNKSFRMLSVAFSLSGLNFH